MEIMEILALLGLVAVLFTGMKWGPLVFAPVLDFFGQILKLLSQLPRTIFVVVTAFILIKFEFEIVPINFPDLNIATMFSIAVVIALVIAFLWDIRTAKFPGLKIMFLKKRPKPISD